MDSVISLLLGLLIGLSVAVAIIEKTDDTILLIKSQRKLCESKIKRTERCEIESVNFNIVSDN